MKKAWALLIIAVVIAAQWTLISSFDSISASGVTSGTGAVVILKAKYVIARVHIQVFPNSQSSVSLIFSEGSRKEVNGLYSFDVILPRSGSFPGGFFSTDSRVGIGVSDESPIGIAILSDLPENYTYQPPGPYFLSDRIDVYWFRIEGNARVTVNLYRMTS